MIAIGIPGTEQWLWWVLSPVGATQPLRGGVARLHALFGIHTYMRTYIQLTHVTFSSDCCIIAVFLLLCAPPLISSKKTRRDLYVG